MADPLPDMLAVIDQARQRLGMSAHDLWLNHFAVGGNGSLDDVQSWLVNGGVPGREHNLMAQALNDEYTGRGLNHPVAYRD